MSAGQFQALKPNMFSSCEAWVSVSTHLSAQTGSSTSISMRTSDKQKMYVEHPEGSSSYCRVWAD